MKKNEYLKIRTKAYEFVGEIGTLAELNDGNEYLLAAYSKACLSLDEIDQLGYSLGYLDAETNNEI